jgi:hypothetical protein
MEDPPSGSASEVSTVDGSSDGRERKKGNDYADLVAAYIHLAHGTRQIDVFREVRLGMNIIGKRRGVDILVVETTTGKALALECKYQGHHGTTDEKIPYALEDLRSMHMPACLVYGGDGWSQGVLSLLRASTSAVHCMPDPKNLSLSLPPRNADGMFVTWELDQFLGVIFGWWDLLPAHRKIDGAKALDAGARWAGGVQGELPLISGPRKGPKRAPRAKAQGKKSGDVS